MALAVVSTARKPRVATPARWHAAAQRARDENIEVRQVNATGMWVANSSRDPRVAYVLDIVNNVVHSCSCPAGEFGDPCCKHAARFYLDAGVLDPEPDPPAPVAAFRYRSGERVVNFEEFADGIYWAKGTGSEGRTVQVGPRGTLTELRDRFTSRGWEPIAA